MKMTFWKCVTYPSRNTPDYLRELKELQLLKESGLHHSVNLVLSDDNFILGIYHEITAGCSGHCRQGVWNRQSHHEARLSLSTVYIIFICQITALHRSQPWQCLWMVSSISRSTLWAAEALYCCSGRRNYFHGSVKTAVIALKLTIVYVGDFQVLVVVCQMEDNMQMEWIVKIIVA